MLYNINRGKGRPAYRESKLIPSYLAPGRSSQERLQVATKEYDSAEEYNREVHDHYERLNSAARSRQGQEDA